MMADIPAELIALGIDSIITAIFYKLYWDSSRSARLLKEAQLLPIDEHLRKTVAEAEGGTIPYAVVQGYARALGKPIGSVHSDDAVGVVQNLTLVEHSVEWNKYSRFWSDKTRTIRDATNVVPFALDCHGHGVSVADPTLAHGLDESLSVIYHHYDSRQSSVGEHVMDWLSGSKTKGLEETERMLLEGTRVTAVGEIAIDGDVVVRPPSCGALYIVTTLSHSELMRSFEGKSRWFRFFAVAAGVVGVGLAVVVAERSYRAWRIRSDARRNRERAEERRRHLAAGSAERQERRAAALEPCVVCMENPRECVMLECGHICLCYDCVEQLPTMHCPVCRADVSRIVPTFLS